MAFDYASARLTAQSLINNFGGAGQAIKKGTTGGYDSGGDPLPDEPDVIIDGLVTPLLQYKTMEIDGTKIKHGDSYVFFHSEIEPEINMQITIDGKTLRIIDSYKLGSIDGVNVFRKFQLRV